VSEFHNKRGDDEARERWERDAGHLALVAIFCFAVVVLCVLLLSI